MPGEHATDPDRSIPMDLRPGRRAGRLAGRGRLSPGGVGHDRGAGGEGVASGVFAGQRRGEVAGLRHPRRRAAAARRRAIRALLRRARRRAGARARDRAGDDRGVLRLRVSVLRARAQDHPAGRARVRRAGAGRLQGLSAGLPQPRDGRGAGGQVGAGAGQVLGVPRPAVSPARARHAAARRLRPRGGARHEPAARGPRGLEVGLERAAGPATGAAPGGDGHAGVLHQWSASERAPSRSRCCAR